MTARIFSSFFPNLVILCPATHQKIWTLLDFIASNTHPLVLHAGILQWMAGKATIRLLTFSTGFAICRAGRFKGSWCTLLIGRLISPIIRQLRDEFKILLFTSLCYSFYSRNFLSSALLLIYLSLKFPFFLTSLQASRFYSYQLLSFCPPPHIIFLLPQFSSFLIPLLYLFIITFPFLLFLHCTLYCRNSFLTFLHYILFTPAIILNVLALLSCSARIFLFNAPALCHFTLEFLISILLSPLEITVVLKRLSLFPMIELLPSMWTFFQSQFHDICIVLQKGIVEEKLEE